MARLTLFIDDGGVMNDNTLRGAQWQRLVGEFFAPTLGGSREAWAAANHKLITDILAPDAWLARLRSSSDYEGFERTYYLDWLTSMCAMLGIPPPPEEDVIQMSREATAWAISNVRAAFPGVIDAIRLVYNRGYTLHTASGESSTDLRGYLVGMGILDCFSRLYGPNLVEAFKLGPVYYERLFADAGVAPGDALVVDDNMDALDWAAEVGARTVLVGTAQANRVCEVCHNINSLAELPELLEQLA